jgi:DNA repair exonuclease SbcCD nuclease subunit
MSEKHPFLRWESNSIHIVNNTRKFIIDNMSFLFVPYVPPGRFLEAIGGFDDYRCIFAHQEFKGCKMGSIISEHGDTIPDIDIISGHIHERQRIGKLYYPGTPYQTNMGESSDKSISLLEFTNTTILETRIALPSIPKKITIDVTASQLLSWTPPDSHNRYRLTVHGTNAEFITLSKSGTISKLTHMGVKITYKEIKSQSLVLEARRERLNFKDIFMERVLSAHEIKDDLMKIIREIY